MCRAIDEGTIDLATRFQTNRVAYTDAKTDFIRRAEGNEKFLVLTFSVVGAFRP